MPRIPLSVLALTVLLAAGCASSRELDHQEERQLKLGLAKEHARELTPIQRTHFLGTRYGTEELVRDRLMRLIEANRVHGRSAIRDRATLMELYKMQAGPRVTRTSPRGGEVTGAGADGSGGEPR